MEHERADANPFDDWAELLAFWNTLVEFEDIQMYQRLARQLGRPVVELGIGDGRVAAHTAPDYGVDVSQAMLERCRARLPDGPRLLLADLRDYDLPEPAAFTYVPFNAFNHVLSRRDRAEVFRTIWRNSLPGGHLAFDSVVPNRSRLHQRSNIPVFRGRSDRKVLFDITNIVDLATNEAVLQIYVDTLDEQGRLLGRKYYAPVPFYFIFPAEYRALARATGWTIEAVWGGFHDEPLTNDSRVQVWLLQRR